MSAVYANEGSVVPHGSVSYFDIQFIPDGSGGFIVSGENLGVKEKFSLTKLHGWLLWVAWGLFGFLQPVSTRYMKKWWRLNMWIHRLGGTFILLSTIAMSIVGISKLDWKLTGATSHYVIGLIIFFAVTFVAVGGVFARSMTRRLKWSTKKIHRIQGIHKWGGRILIILAQVTILLGVKEYNEKYSTKESPLGIVNIVVYFGLLFICEFVFRLYLSSEPAPFKTPQSIMTLDEFNQKSKSQCLVLLDDLVLDVTQYMDNHPGGRFVFEHCISQDVSKFFYGGYGLDGNAIKGGAKPRIHSNVARAVVDTLAIARFVGSEKSSGTL